MRHGDEYDRLVASMPGWRSPWPGCRSTTAAGINGLRCACSTGRPVQPLPTGRNAEAILESAVELLASHREWPIPVSRGLNSSGGFSLAFALESALKGRTGHDRLIKRRIVQHLQRQAQGTEPLDGLINGHTHIPEATALALPAPVGCRRRPLPHHLLQHRQLGPQPAEAGPHRAWWWPATARSAWCASIAATASNLSSRPGSPSTPIRCGPARGAAWGWRIWSGFEG